MRTRTVFDVELLELAHGWDAENEEKKERRKAIFFLFFFLDLSH